MLAALAALKRAIPLVIEAWPLIERVLKGWRAMPPSERQKVLDDIEQDFRRFHGPDRDTSELGKF